MPRCRFVCLFLSLFCLFSVSLHVQTTGSYFLRRWSDDSDSDDDDDDDDDGGDSSSSSSSTSSSSSSNNKKHYHIERRGSRFLPSTHCSTKRHQHVRLSGQGAKACKSRATHRALIVCNVSCATRYEWTAQLLSLAEFRSHLFRHYFIA